MGAAAPIFMGLSALSTVASTASQIIAGGATSDAAKYNAALNERNATLALNKGAEDEQMFRINARKFIGSIEAKYGGSGITGGSAESVLMESVSNAEHDALNIRHKAEQDALGYRMGANLDRMKAGSAETGGYLGAAGALASGAGQFYRDFGGSSYTGSAYSGGGGRAIGSLY